MYKYFMLLIALLFLSCATGELVRKDISYGMSKEKLINVLGNPDGFRIVGDQELLTYTNRLISGWSWDRADYHFVIKDNKVVAYGTVLLHSLLDKSLKFNTMNFHSTCLF